MSVGLSYHHRVDGAAIWNARAWSAFVVLWPRRQEGSSEIISVAEVYWLRVFGKFLRVFVLCTSTIHIPFEHRNPYLNVKGSQITRDPLVHRTPLTPAGLRYLHPVQ